MLNYISIKEDVKVSELITERKNGKFKEVDFLESYFSGYEIELNAYKRGGLKRSKNVYVDPKRK